MCNIKEFVGVLEKYAPLSLSKKMIEKGAYDNSGVIVHSSSMVKRVLFSLDLSNASVAEAERLGCDTIVTHHPAIYTPIKDLDIDGETGALLRAISLKMNVISMHLNLDIAERGIDQCLAEGLGGKDIKVLDYVTETNGYGREGDVKEVDASEFLQAVKCAFGTDKAVLYGSGKVKKVASFCGSGASEALNAQTDADLIVTSDVQHHELKELIERGKNVIILPHYVSEQYGFNKFYVRVKGLALSDVEVFYFIDKRFI